MPPTFAPPRAAQADDRHQFPRLPVLFASEYLEDEFGARYIRVRGPAKVMAHLSLALLALGPLPDFCEPFLRNKNPQVTQFKVQ